MQSASPQAPSAASPAVTGEQLRAFHRDGYLVLRGLFTPADVTLLIDTFMGMHAAGPIPGCFEPKSPEKAGDDVLARYPRMMNPHRVNPVARRYLLDARLAPVLGALLAEEPIAAQSMLYFKPPGARGQALHQDNFYLQVEPGTCLAAWVALDPADATNGGLHVVPGTHAMDLFCPEEADASVSFTRDYVPPPPGLTEVPVDLAAGDVLFFNGSLVHGSPPNSSADRFRRSFICHYTGRSADRIARHYQPLLSMAGEEIEIAVNTSGGPCGVEVPVPH